MEQLKLLKQQYSEEEQLAQERFSGQALEMELYDIRYSTPIFWPVRQNLG